MALILLHPWRASTLIFTVILVITQLTQQVNSEPTQDKQALLTFISQTPHANRLQWNASDSACNWFGVKCDSSHTFIYSLHLPGVGLVGPIPPNTIGRLSNLRVLSLRSNGLTGEIPADFSNLTRLRNLYLQHNNFSGEFPNSLTRLTRLTRLELSFNSFAGSIPFEVKNLTQLTGLFLQNNLFEGKIPSITNKLVNFNVSNNRLNGSIPESLINFPESSFTGNLNLCGGPLEPCNPLFPSPAPSPSSLSPPATRKSKRLSTAAIGGIVIGSVVVALLFLVLVICFCRRKRPANLPPAVVAARGGVSTTVTEGGTASSSKDDVTGSAEAGERNKLVFLEGGIYSFDLEDLLRASAEVLGKGSMGTSYKAILEERTTVVVKRLKDVVVKKKEFEMQMEVVGKIKHENLVPLRAFYYSKDEKLLVFDYMPAGSLSALLHGSRGSGRRTPLDWDTRMRIVLGTAKGISFLHVSGKIVHDNIKSSNILLRQNHDPSISDFGLKPVIGNSAPSTRFAGYQAPEILETRKPTFQSDVYSFGVLLLELLTGKSPNQASLGSGSEEGIDLPRWVQSVVREEWTAEVFDAELMRYHNIEEEMVQLLQIAMTCVSLVPDQRPTMQEVVRMIEDINRSETDDGLRQSSDDPSKGSDGHTPPQESRTTPRSDMS